MVDGGWLMADGAKSRKSLARTLFLVFGGKLLVDTPNYFSRALHFQRSLDHLLLIWVLRHTNEHARFGLYCI